MRILVTGGAGFVGANFVRHVLATSDHEVTVVDALTYAGSRERLAGLDGLHDPRVRFVLADVADAEAMGAVVPGHDSVVHFAAESHVDRSLLDPEVFTRTNCGGTEVLCAAAGRAGVGRFVHISTDEVYGPVLEGAVDEAAPLLPTSPYARSKAESDRIALRHHAEHGLPVVVTRSSNQYGPWQFPEKLIPFFIATLLGGGRVPVYGDGLHVRNWLHVDDNCAAVNLVLDRGEPGTIYNLGGGNERTNLEVTLAILGQLGLGADRIEHVSDREGHDRRYAIRTDRIERLGLPSPRAFEPGLEETVAWYLANRSWWEPLLGRVRNR